VLLIQQESTEQQSTFTVQDNLVLGQPDYVIYCLTQSRHSIGIDIDIEGKSQYHSWYCIDLKKRYRPILRNNAKKLFFWESNNNLLLSQKSFVASREELGWVCGSRKPFMELGMDVLGNNTFSTAGTLQCERNLV